MTGPELLHLRRTICVQVISGLTSVTQAHGGTVSLQEGVFQPGVISSQLVHVQEARPARHCHRIKSTCFNLFACRRHVPASHCHRIKLTCLNLFACRRHSPASHCHRIKSTCPHHGTSRFKNFPRLLLSEQTTCIEPTCLHQGTSQFRNVQCLLLSEQTAWHHKSSLKKASMAKQGCLPALEQTGN